MPVSSESGPIRVMTRGQLGFEGAGGVNLHADTTKKSKLEWRNATALDDYIEAAGVEPLVDIPVKGQGSRAVAHGIRRRGHVLEATMVERCELL